MSNKMLMNIFSLKKKKKSSCSHVKKKILLILDLTQKNDTVNENINNTWFGEAKSS